MSSIFWMARRLICRWHETGRIPSLFLQACKRGQILNMTWNNSEFDRKCGIKNSNLRLKLIFKFKFDQIWQANLACSCSWSKNSNLVKFDLKCHQNGLFCPKKFLFDLKIHCCVQLLQIKCIWPKNDIKNSRTWSNLVKFGRIWSNLVEFRVEFNRIWSNRLNSKKFEKSKFAWTRTNSSELTSLHLDYFQLVITCMLENNFCCNFLFHFTVMTWKSVSLKQQVKWCNPNLIMR